MLFISGFPSQILVDVITNSQKEKNIVDTLYHSQKKDKDVVDLQIARALLPKIEKAQAATFQMQTGYYVGDGTDNRSISGIGFQPELLLLKDNDATGAEGMIFKTSLMASELSLVMAETDANLTTNHIQSLDSNGFTIGNDADVNTANINYSYIAFAGSDCTASGTFCVGSYTGNGTSQNITSVGFQPDLVVVKRAAGSVGLWKTNAMGGTVSNYFNNANELATQGITALNATGFSIGNNASVNTSASIYHYFAFKEVAGAMDVGSYTGNATDNRAITDPGFQPDFVWVKNRTTTTAQNAIFSIREQYGDRSLNFNDAAAAANQIQFLRSDGFEVGTAATVNTNTETYYFVVFGGSSPRGPGTGNFQMVNGSYTGTGSAFSVTGLPFDPQLVIIKHNDQATDQQSVFRTKLMAGDRTGYIAAATTFFTGGITALGTTSFSVGTNATVNTSGDTYYWTAFGNAMMPDVTTGSSDFLIGQYLGTARDNVDIDRLPIAPNLVFSKRAGANFAGWMTSDQASDTTLFFSATAALTNYIQSLNSDGFQLGANTALNTSGGIYDYFLFEYSDYFATGTYTGNAIAKDITALSFQPDLLWIKKTTGGTARGAIMRTSVQTGDAAQPFLNTATLTDRITGLLKNGFSLGTGAEANESGGATYQYAAWDAKRYTQSTYRFFANTDSTDVGSVLEAQNTPATLASSGDAFRLRMTLRNDYGNLYASGKDFKLQYVDKGVGTCASPSGGTPASYTDVSGATLIAFNNNATPADDSALTPNANDPTDGGRTIVNQSYIEANPFTNNQSAITNQSQSGKWDFSLIDNGADGDTTFCFRVIGDNGTPLETFTTYPEITTAIGGGGPQTLSFSISDNSIGFGTLTSANARFATGDGAGSDTNSVDAHTITASTNASGGYVITLNGTTLTCSTCDDYQITAIGATAAPPSAVGTEQFGVRGEVNSGSGSVLDPYNVAGRFGYDTAAFPDAMLTGAGDEVSTVFGIRYVGSISDITPAGEYSALLNYTITASF